MSGCAELAAYAAWSVGGIPGVAWLYCLGVLSIFGALYWSSRSFSRPVVAAATTAAGVMGMSSSLTAPAPTGDFLFRS